MIRKFYFLLVTFLLIASTLFAQTEEESAEPPKEYRPNIAIKVVPLALIARAPAIQFALEAKTFKSQAIQIEYGYIANFFDRPNTSFNGFKLKTEYRYYWNNKRKGRNNLFVGLQHMYKKIDASGTAPVWRNEMTYQEILPLTVVNKTHAGYLVFGRVFPFSKSFFMELGLGLGRKTIKVSIDGVPEDGEINRGLSTNIFNSINTPGTYNFPDLFLSLKFNYVFF